MLNWRKPTGMQIGDWGCSWSATERRFNEFAGDRCGHQPVVMVCEDEAFGCCKEHRKHVEPRPKRRPPRKPAVRVWRGYAVLWRFGGQILLNTAKSIDLAQAGANGCGGIVLKGKFVGTVVAPKKARRR